LFFGALSVIFLTVDSHALWLYRGGFPLIAAGCALIVNRALPGDPATAPLRARPIVWVGRLSYGLYLYHLPIYFFLGRELQGQRHTFLGLIAISITFTVATASYYFVEQPIRREL